MLEWGIVTNDQRIKELAKSGYEWARQLGIARIGFFVENTCPEEWGNVMRTESCNIGRMVGLAIRLTEAGVGEYWEDVDQYVRNQLVENQVLDAKRCRQLAGKQPPSPPLNSPRETDENVIERNIGGFTGWGQPDCIPPHIWVEGCCTGNASNGLYYAWEGIVRFVDGTATVNLLLNRASPWMDIDSHLPYEGKVVIRNKKAKKLRIRIPAWVDKSTVKCKVGNKLPRDYDWLGNYLCIDRVKTTDKITITFEMVLSKASYSHMGKTFDFTFKGNTVIDVSPQPKGDYYLLYQRKKYRGQKAPTRKVTRYVHPEAVAW